MLCDTTFTQKHVLQGPWFSEAHRINVESIQNIQRNQKYLQKTKQEKYKW